jgi:hypothetical protein
MNHYIAAQEQPNDRVLKVGFGSYPPGRRAQSSGILRTHLQKGLAEGRASGRLKNAVLWGEAFISSDHRSVGSAAMRATAR